MPIESRWSLRHAWRSEPDLAALALCRERLGSVGIDLVDAGPAESADAVKMHGMEIVDALATGDRPLHDLREVALAGRWEDILPSFVRRYMVHGECWHGIPMGIHRANAVWANAALAIKVGSRAPADLTGFLVWLEQARRHARAPLAIGAEPWQVGVLFEAVVLAVAGPALYRRAFVQLQPSAWREAAMIEALDRLLALRAFVGDKHLGLDWADQLARVQRGEAAVQIMGDWVRAAGDDSLLEWAAPGTAGRFVAIIDYFVPLARTPGPVAERAAMALTAPEFQGRFARRKGCLPAVREAWIGIDPLRTGLPGCDAAVLPSLTFDQCCAVGTKQALLDVVAHYFVHGGDSSACARALAETAAEPMPLRQK
jgi:glucose/mannose transport system substrate-binding protein